MTTRITFLTMMITLMLITTFRPSPVMSQSSDIYNDSWALLIGVNRYKHLPKSSHLRFAVDDVTSMKQVLIDDFGFREGNIFLLVDEQATKQNILNAMSQLTDTNKIDQNDRVLIHFSGHGQTVTLLNRDEMGFLIPYDAEVKLDDPQNPAHYYRTCVGMDELSRLSRLIPAKHVLFLVDACYSGLATKGIPPLTPDLPDYLMKVAKLPARQIITAGLRGEQVFEERGHGVFTLKVLDALKDGLADRSPSDNVTTATELAAYLKGVVPQVSNGRQHPHDGRFEGEGEFIFQHSMPPMKDEEKPKIRILKPESLRRSRAFVIESVTDGFELVGIATDNVGVVSVQVNGDNVPITEASPDEIESVGLPRTQVGVRFETPLSLSAPPLQEIKIQASDAAGNSTELLIPIRDTKPPTIEIAEPEGLRSARSIQIQATDNRTALRLAGVVRDDGGVKQVTVNGKPVQTPATPQKELQFETTIALSAGATLVEVRAEDAAGNIARRQMVIEPAPPEGMVFIPAGAFSMGSPQSEGSDDEHPRHEVTVDSFYIDKYEVTVGQYRVFIEAAGHRAPNWGKVAKYAPTDRHPMVMVNWHDADAYATWTGKRLPTEAEWEKAARGGLINVRYPLSNSITHDDANFDGMDGKDRWKYTASVGNFQPNGHNLYDMAGNVWEWCADWYDSAYYAKSPKRNPRGPASGQRRALRGGSWDESPDDQRVANRQALLPRSRFADVGFRCVRGAESQLVE